MNQIQNDNQIKVETRCSCYDFMSRMSPRDLNSTGIYERRSKGQPPAVLAGPRYVRNIQSHLKTIRLNHLCRRAESTVRFLTLDGPVSGPVEVSGTGGETARLSAYY